jgi:hypothetical protein
MTIENEEVQQEPSLRETLEAAVAEHTEPAEKVEVVADTGEKKERDESGKFKTKDVVEAPIIAAKSPPQAWGGTKEEFFALPATIQDRIIQREEEVHKGFTKLDEERNLGKSMKEVITPYMAVIQAEGGTPQGAVKDLLNTAYVLRTGSPQQKAQIVAQIVQQYGVDMRNMGQQQIPQNQPPAIDPEKITQDIMTRLQSQQQDVKVQSEIEAFSVDPKNVHFSNQEVKAAMASLLQTGQAKDLQDAYDKAVWLIPSIRTTLLQSQQVDTEQKRKDEIAAKKKAGSSVSGSPGISIPNSGNPDRSLREELVANMAALRS